MAYCRLAGASEQMSEAVDSQWVVFLFLIGVLAVNCLVRVLSSNDWLCEWISVTKGVVELLMTILILSLMYEKQSWDNWRFVK